MSECNTILSAYTLYRHLGYCCTHLSIYCVVFTYSLDKCKILLTVFGPALSFVTHLLESVIEKTEKSLGKGDSAGHQDFLLSLKWFGKAALLKIVKIQVYLVKGDSILCPRIERSGAYCFTVVRPSVRLSVCLSVCTNLT